MSLDLLLKQLKATKKGKTTSLFFSLLFLCWIRDPRSVIRDRKKSGSGINIPDPQH